MFLTIDLLKEIVFKLAEILLTKSFYEICSKAIALAIVTKHGSNNVDGRFVWRDMDLEDFNMIRDLSVTYYEGNKCEYCGVRHFLAEGTKLIPDIAELWLRVENFLGYKNLMAHILLSTRMLCDVTVYGEKKIKWVELGQLNFNKNGSKLRYQCGKDKVRDINKPLGVARRTILTYRLEGNKIVVTPIIQVIVGDWIRLNEDVLRSIIVELDKCGETKKIVLGDEKMFLAIPTRSKHIEHLLKGIRDKRKIGDKNVRVLAELCNGNIAKQLKNMKHGEKSKWLRNKIFDFIKPSDTEMVGRILDLYSRIVEKVGEKRGKLMNGVGIYSIVGEWKVANMVNLIFVDPFWHSYAGLCMISPEILKDLRKLRKALNVKEDLRFRLKKCTYGYRDCDMKFGALYFFNIRVLQLEYLATICNVRFKDIKFEFSVGELSIEDLVRLRNVLKRKQKHWWKYLKNNKKARKIFLEICGFKSLKNVSEKRISAEDAEPKPLMEKFLVKVAKDFKAAMLVRTLGIQFQNNLGVLLHLIEEGKTVENLVNEVEVKLSGRKLGKQAVPTICRLVSNYNPARLLLSEKWREVEEKIKDLDENDPIRVNLEKLKERIDKHTERLKVIEKCTEKTVKSLKNSKIYLAGTL